MAVKRKVRRVVYALSLHLLGCAVLALAVWFGTRVDGISAVAAIIAGVGMHAWADDQWDLWRRGQ